MVNILESEVLTEAIKHLVLGQQELFRAFILLYKSECEKQGTDWKQFLQDLLYYIYFNGWSLCKQSASVPTLYHLQCLCARLLKELSPEVDEVYEYLAKFKILLHEGCRDAPEEIISELNEKFCSKINSHVDQVSVTAISYGCRVYLRHLLQKNTLLGHEIISQLSAPYIDDTYHHQLHISLKMVYVDFLNTTIQTLKRSIEKSPSKISANKLKDSQTTICAVLALCQPGNYFSDIEAAVQQTIRDVVLMCDAGVLDKFGVFLALAAHKDLNLYRLACSIDDEISGRKNATSKSCEYTNYLTKMLAMDVDEVFLQTLLNQTHFLSYLVESCVSLCASNDLELTAKVLDKEPFRKLRPMVVLLTWPRISSLVQAKGLLDNIWTLDHSQSDVDPLLSAACMRLRHHTELVDWCFRHSVQTGRGLSIAEALRKVDQHSSLYVINKLIKLDSVSARQILHLLEKQKSESKGLEDENSCIILRSFCVLSAAISVVYSSVQLDALITGGDGSVTSWYQEHIVAPLDQIQEEVSKLNLLTYRLEVLENIFSLLFMTHRDVRRSRSRDSSSGEEGEVAEHRVH